VRDFHAVHIEQELEELTRRVDDLLLTARVVAVMVAGNFGLHAIAELFS
jgi:hypothetical protein